MDRFTRLHRGMRIKVAGPQTGSSRRQGRGRQDVGQRSNQTPGPDAKASVYRWQR